MRWILAPALISVSASAASLPAEQLELFESKIRPVLASECLECHGAEKQKGGLRLDFRDGWKAGGDSGAAIVPGKPAESLLLKSIRHEDPDLKMPSKRPKLSDASIADFEKWIALGAPDPRDKPSEKNEAVPWEKLLEERKKWWSLQPIRSPEPPAVRDTKWSSHPVDRFLLAKMETANLTPAPEADPRTLYRRLHYVLTGLPPSAEGVDAFVDAAVRDPEAAFSKAVDQLLASPRFGEHWARHWLDLVRYAETHGSEGDPAIPEVWRYRDYVIRAVNDDIPVDQLIREHVAGDRVPIRWNVEEKWNESTLGLAHFRLVEHGFQPIDTRDEQVKVVDSQIDVLTKAFQGMTVACARCHDHKFDAISQRDYTALAGVLESSRPTMITIDSPQAFAKTARELEPVKAEIKNKLAAAWLEEVARWTPNYQAGPARIVQMEAAKHSAATAAELVEDLESTVRARVAKARGLAVPALPQPTARWSFDKDARDGAGALHAELAGGARIHQGRLILDGQEAVARTVPLGRELREKTLEAWVALSSLDQTGGGVITVENASGAVFDSIVFAEKERRRWMAGSDFYRRSRAANGPEETSKPGELIHLVAVYRADNTITLYRNGQLYGAAWTGGEPLVVFDAKARLLFGRRHTGGGNAMLAGEIEEARLYDRAINAPEIAASFQAGPAMTGVTEKELAAAMTDAERATLGKLREELRVARANLDLLAPNGKDPWQEALADAAKNPGSPLHAWATGEIPAKPNAEPDGRNIGLQKFPLPFGNWPGALVVRPGAFPVPIEGDRLITHLMPAGVGTGLVTRKHGAIASTRRFQINTDYISIRASGANAWCRVMLDGYPLPNGQIFPRIAIDQKEERWLTMDVKYRKGAWAYLEFATAGDLTRAEKADPRSWFFVSDIEAHDDQEPRPEPKPNHAALLAGVEGDLITRYRTITTRAIRAWSTNDLDEPLRAWLDYFVRRDLLPTHVETVKSARTLWQQFRTLENLAPVPRRAPGVMDADGADAAFLPRGDHLKPGEPVPRGYLGVLGFGEFSYLGENSGRLRLAHALTDEKNPLTPRVMVNRIWLHLFGQGIVATPDSFGKMGELPSHPELLDYLAARFVRERWSTKRMIRELLLTRAWRLSGESTPAARERDPGNALLSHARVRRLPAENIRDTLFALSGRLDATMFGPGAAPSAPRRSIYLNIRRTALHPFLTTFDAPKPFSTLGRRDSTNVPAQSLALLNDPFVADCAAKWADQHQDLPPERRLLRMFTEAFARPPSAAEKAAAERYLADGTAESWRDLAHSLINVKEFIYLQ